MSRRCPKRNHHFLNWLKANRSRFIIAPYTCIESADSIGIGFPGILPAIKCTVEFTTTGGPWISVDIKQDDGEIEGIVRFYGAEQKIAENCWTSLKLRPEDQRYWQTREELWSDICFEQFLLWCNNNLIKYRC